MQIHELPQHSGTPTNESVFAIDTGTSSFKIPFASLGEAIIAAVTTTINGTVQTVKAAIEALAGRVTTAEGNIADLTPRVETLEETATSLQTQITDMQTIVNTSISFLGKTTGVFRSGKVVTFTFSDTPAVEIPARTDYVAGTLPEGFRPAYSFISSFFNSAGIQLQVQFGANGQIRLYNFSTSSLPANSGWIRGSYTFIRA